MKNYTSTVSATKSMNKIEHYLAQNGVLNISKTYNDNHIEAIYFQVNVNGATIPFKLPANVEACYNVLKLQRRRPPNKSQEKALREQAERTAWKIISEWIEIQMSLIEMEQAEFMEIFLPYVALNDTTFYNKIKKDGFKLLSKN